MTHGKDTTNFTLARSGCFSQNKTVTSSEQKSIAFNLFCWQPLGKVRDVHAAACMRGFLYQAWIHAFHVTWHWFQTDPVRKSNRIGLLFPRDRFGTGAERNQNWIAGPILDMFRTGSKTVACKQKSICCGAV